jgi:hypothetical protein
MDRSALACCLAFVATLAAYGCAGGEATIAGPPTPTPTPSTPPPTITDALSLPERDARREAMLAAVGGWLRDPSVRTMDDEAASAQLTELAFSSGRMVFGDPTFVRRPGQPSLAVVGLPDALGLYLYDLDAPSAEPLELSGWTAGLNAVYVTWAGGEVGVAYFTLGNDRQTRAHFVLASEAGGRWQVAWLADEEPAWWFNARQAELVVSSDLQTLILTGEAQATTLVFDERGDVPRRRFSVTWERDEETSAYLPASQPEDFPSRTEWLWSMAEPSPYAALVEFLERLRLRDEGARQLAEGEVVEAALALALDQPQRQYRIINQTATRLVFQDSGGAYTASFRPAPTGARWRLTDIEPMTVATPTPPSD